MFNEAFVCGHGSDRVKLGRINHFDDWFLLLSRCSKFRFKIKHGGKFLAWFSHWFVIRDFSSLGGKSVPYDFCLLEERLNSIFSRR